MESAYKSEMGTGSRLFVGAAYLGSGVRAKGHPFFASGDLLPGDVFYAGHFYMNLKLQYDLVNDDLLVRDFSDANSIILTPEKIKFFTIEEHLFFYLAPDASASRDIQPGFYEKLYEGAVSVYARREKKVEHPANAEEEAYYKQTDNYFIKLNGRYYPVDGKKILLEVFQDKKDLIKKFIKDNGLDFRKNIGQALIRTAGYYDQIKK